MVDKSVKVIETDKLTKSYGASRGIIDVNLEVKQGEIFGFIGPNGAGKSTTIRTLLGLIHPSSGTAKLFGKDIATQGPEIRQRIGYLPSEVFYYDNMRVIDLLRYSASFYDVDRATIERRIQKLADDLDLPLTRKIDDLSYGNKKKVGIIQGLLHEPELIILDEPTGGLDPLMQQKFFELLREENKRGATILFSSHNLTEVQKMCSRVAIIKEGKLIRVETIANLIDNSYMRVHAELAMKPAANPFEKLSGTNDMSVDGAKISFLYQGSVNALMQKLSSHDLRSLLITEPDLEEIFLHYYKRD